jgi:uncharacterized protein YlzI (FlbEa/FlbD family)
MGLARLTETKINRNTFVNPDHVRTVHEISGIGTEITFSDGKSLIVKEGVNVVVAAIQGAQS